MKETKFPLAASWADPRVLLGPAVYNSTNVGTLEKYNSFYFAFLYFISVKKSGSDTKVPKLQGQCRQVERCSKDFSSSS